MSIGFPMCRSRSIAWGARFLRKVSRSPLHSRWEPLRMSPTIGEFAVALIANRFSATCFTKRVEILGGRLGMRREAVGSLLAEVGAMLPGGLIALGIGKALLASGPVGGGSLRGSG